ncbi:PTS sugar transporter subunit IIA [Rossellomorea marisflavi]|uniref:PTS sugar transporter subunit IIA n=1 Tax=Rossellomorea marisflavi TaxID=189381 RepID=UPI0009E21770|nr:PTS transporter subunit EIIA [Rossellomorea marisflavi]TYO69041.1 PTS sugar transporter subunit IIA [Rossellomorea marisflavi]
MTQLLLSPELIFLEKEFDTKDDVMNFIGDVSVKFNITDNKEALVRDLWQREKEYSTGLAESVALPHTKSDAVMEARICFIRLKNEVDWNSLDGKDVKYVFGILMPSSNLENLHLKVIASLATNLLEDEFKEKLESLETAEEFYQYFTNQIGA